ncbi:hypothetical protein LEP1GSC025_2408 [Leptospira interrogans str. 2002000621]|nr:hypothetical protein LEP1GSC025_2408 [Leptospira interrogans str. 2002000621]
MRENSRLSFMITRQIAFKTQQNALYHNQPHKLNRILESK